MIWIGCALGDLIENKEEHVCITNTTDYFVWTLIKNKKAYSTAKITSYVRASLFFLTFTALIFHHALLNKAHHHTSCHR